MAANACGLEIVKIRENEWKKFQVERSSDNWDNGEAEIESELDYTEKSKSRTK